jgi:hypothetical protein
MVAVTATAIGFAYDAGSGDKELSNVFAAMYVIGCITAVLAVRQAGIFTAVVQPPLILFVAVPGAYWLFHGAHVTGLKDILINCGYPLIERFLLMLFTAAAVLLIGVGRWLFGRSARPAVAAETTAGGGLGALGDSITTKMSGLFTSESDDDDDAPRRRHAIDRPSSTPTPAKASRATKAAKRPAPTRSRHARPPLTEVIEPVAERPRRQRAGTSRQAEPPPEPRRRRSTARDIPREGSSRDPYERREPYERRAPHDRRSRHDSYDSYEPFEPYEAPPRRRPGSNGSHTNTTHHPISRVRYRGAAEDDDGAPEYRTRSRSRARPREADAWEYDI